MKSITFKEFAEKVQHMGRYSLTLIKEENNPYYYWEAEVHTYNNWVTSCFLKYLVKYNLNIQVKDNKVIIDNL